MENFKVEKILIPVDFSETALLALEHAANMAKLFNAEVTLLNVVETLNFTTAMSDSFPDPTFEMAWEKHAKERLDILCRSLDSSGIRYKTRTVIGRIYQEIVNVAQEIKADVIVMGTHGVSGFKEFFIGSNAYRVVSEAECPVITVQSHAKTPGFKNIVLPIDNSSTSRQKVNHAVEMAKKFGSKIHILGLLPDTDDQGELDKFDIIVEQVEDFLKNKGVEFTSKKLAGDHAAKTTMTYAFTIDADLIMIMTEQDPDITGFFMGAMAQQLVNHSKIPVMTIRADASLTQGYVFPYWT